MKSYNDPQKNKELDPRNSIAHRSDVLFLYDSRMANPNGDPDENRPRIDPYSRVNLVTDYRLKRTIRDYMLNHYNNEPPNKIFIREELNQKKNKKRIEDLAEEYIEEIKNNKINSDDKKKIRIVNKEEILKQHIDVRLFGLMFLVSDITFKELGPVQFSIGTSLNIPQEILIRNTRIVPTKDESKSGTFGEKAILKYSLILFHGFINQIVAKRTILTENDITKMMLGMWYGTNDLSTSSKYGQTSRFLLRIIYSNEYGYIGDLDRNIILNNNSKEDIEDISQAQINLSNLFKKLEKNINIIKELQFACYEDLNIFIDEKHKDLKEYIKQWSQKNKVKAHNILDQIKNK